MKKVMIGILLMVFNMGLSLGQDSEIDPLQRHLFSAESIMRNQRELQLDERAEVLHGGSRSRKRSPSSPHCNGSCRMKSAGSPGLLEKPGSSRKELC